MRLPPEKEAELAAKYNEALKDECRQHLARVEELAKGNRKERRAAAARLKRNSQ